MLLREEAPGSRLGSSHRLLGGRPAEHRQVEFLVKEPLQLRPLLVLRQDFDLRVLIVDRSQEHGHVKVGPLIGEVAESNRAARRDVVVSRTLPFFHRFATEQMTQ